jgi:hypothetical protein
MVVIVDRAMMSWLYSGFAGVFHLGCYDDKRAKDGNEAPLIVFKLTWGVTESCGQDAAVKFLRLSA